MTPETTETLDTQLEVLDEGVTPKSLTEKISGKKISAKNMVRLERRVGIFRRNKEVEPIIKQYVEELAPATKREMKLVERIAALQLQVNQGLNVEVTKTTMARLIKRVIGK